MAKINKRTIILLIVAVAIWIVAIAFLIRMNTPKPVVEVKPVQPTPDLENTQQSNQNIQNQGPTTSSQNQQQNQQIGIAQQNQSVSLVELKNIMPESTFTDFLTPYKLELKVSLKSGFLNFNQMKNQHKQLI